MEVISDFRNELLSRRELVILLRGMAGKISRKELREMVSKEFGVESSKVIPIRLEGEFGRNDLKALVYIYDDEKHARRQLPEYIFLRQLSKDERRKLLEERRKAKVKAV